MLLDHANTGAYDGVRSPDVLRTVARSTPRNACRQCLQNPAHGGDRPTRFTRSHPLK